MVYGHVNFGDDGVHFGVENGVLEGAESGIGHRRLRQLVRINCQDRVRIYVQARVANGRENMYQVSKEPPY